MKLLRLNEDLILKKILERTKMGSGSRMGLEPLVLGIGDDAALFRPKAGHQTILTCDWFLEGTHFLREKHPPDSVGWKCLARAISDVAAMGGEPRCFLLSLAIPTSLTGRWLDEFLLGLKRASVNFQCPLAGGDTTCSNKVLTNVTVIGEARKGYAVLRSGSLAGDLLYVSGRLGEAELGLRLLKRSNRRASRKNPLIRKHLYPEPRLALGHWLATTGLASAMMDLSDGLSSDLMRLCAASCVGARLDATKIPTAQISAAKSSQGLQLLQIALHGGDDYELLFTVPSRKASLLPRKFKGVLLTPVGRITKNKKVLLVEGVRTHQFAPGGWDPFRRAARRKIQN